MLPQLYAVKFGWTSSRVTKMAMKSLTTRRWRTSMTPTISLEINLTSRSKSTNWPIYPKIGQTSTASMSFILTRRSTLQRLWRARIKAHRSNMITNTVCRAWPRICSNTFWQTRWLSRFSETKISRKTRREYQMCRKILKWKEERSKPLIGPVMTEAPKTPARTFQKSVKTQTKKVSKARHASGLRPKMDRLQSKKPNSKRWFANRKNSKLSTSNLVKSMRTTLNTHLVALTILVLRSRVRWFREVKLFL